VANFANQVRQCDLARPRAGGRGTGGVQCGQLEYAKGKRKRGGEARLPPWAVDVLGQPGAWSFGPTLWSTLMMMRRMAAIGR
jgi:hypothetical protein